MANRIYFTPLDSGQKVEEKYLPSYVDDVLEFENLQAFPETGETGKIYLALDSNFTYRWSGSTYIFIGNEFNLSDRIAKGVDANGNVVEGAVIEGEIGANTASGTHSHAEGSATIASGEKSHAEGGGTTASGVSSHAEGYSTQTGVYNSSTQTYSDGWGAHAEGSYTVAGGSSSHAEGYTTVAGGDYSHAGGAYTKASRRSQTVIGEYNVEDIEGSSGINARGKYAFIIGNGDSDNNRSNAFAIKWDGSTEECRGKTYGPMSHAEGEGSVTGLYDYTNKIYTGGKYAHAEGNYTTAGGQASHAEGAFGVSATGEASHAEGINGTTASGKASHAEGGYGTTAAGECSHAEGNATRATGDYAHAEGKNSVASGNGSHAGGLNTKATRRSETVIGEYNVGDDTGATTDSSTRGEYAFEIGNGTSDDSRSDAFCVKWDGSVREGSGPPVGGTSAHAEGYGTHAIGNYSHVEGNGSTASGSDAHAEGHIVTASGNYSHAEGSNTAAIGVSSHAEGNDTRAIGANSHAEGIETYAVGYNSHTSGEYTSASNKDQFVIGKFNSADPIQQGPQSLGSYAFIVGNGTANDARSNAFAIKWDGTFVFADGTEITPAQFASLKALLNT